MKNVMKNTKKGILMVTMMATLASFANENFNAELIGNVNKTALVLNNVKVGDLLTIKDYNGVILYKETIESEGVYKKGFNLTALPDGDYFFEVDKFIEIKIIPFTVKSKKVLFHKEGKTSVFKPYIRQKDGTVLITKLAPNLEPLKIKIYADYNSEYSLMYSDVVENTRSIEKAYKLEKGGNYKIEISSDNRTYTKFINN
ncbi:hypothetical protein GSB9_02246 [Flavobacteriaceae bacterium GSB9]|nr:hypothetical protein GSB9_02246 [Flavobacteriaceae bacterium GSB9]